MRACHLTTGHNKDPHQPVRDVRSGRGQPSRKISAPARGFFKPARKQLPAPPENKKNIALAFLKVA
jgi:hypothetical protein